MLVRSTMISRLAGLLLLAAISTGCSEDYYRAETVLHSDGSVDRAIYQPAGHTPEATRQAKNWDHVTFAEKRKHEEWESPIRELPDAKHDEKHDYFVAWGKFISAEGIPDYFVVKSPDGKQAGRLKRSYVRHDYVLLTEHRWKETLTDVVTLSDMRRARRELAALLISIAREVLDEGLPDVYDTSKLMAWLEKDATAAFEDCIDVLYEVAQTEKRNPLQEQILQKRLTDVAVRYGLKLTNDDGVMLENEAFGEAVAKFSEQKLRELLRRTDGKPLEAATIDHILKRVGLKDDEKRQNNRKPSRLEVIAEKVITRRFGSGDEFEKEVHTLLSRIVGVYLHPIVNPPRRFHYSMKVPGIVVETDGGLMGKNEVQWSFDAADAFPFGYPMNCRSLESNTAVQKKLFGRVVLSDPKEMEQFVRLISGNDELLKALRASAAQKSLKLLRQYQYADGVAQTIDIDKVSELKRLWKLLQLPK